MSKHTPGPWHVGTGNGIGSVFAGEGLRRDSTGLYPICHMVPFDSEEEDEANAALIAKAPLLKRRLEAAAEICATMADPEHCLHEAVKYATTAQWKAWRDCFREALRLAEGGQDA